MRIRLNMKRTVLFTALLAFALVALLPLRIVAGWYALEGRGLAAREANGSLWLGALKEAQFGALPLGDLQARLNVLPLFLGRARLSLSRDQPDDRFGGAVTVSRHDFGVDDVTGRLRTGAIFAPIPIAMLDLADVSAHFDGGQCSSAEGEVRAVFAGHMAGLMLPSGLRGSVRCSEGALLLPLVSQSGMEQVNLRFMADGRWRIDLAVRSFDPATATSLTAAGFMPSGGTLVRRVEGSF
jgi:general secretion pathway protein N